MNSKSTSFHSGEKPVVGIVGKPNCSDQFKKIVKRYIRVGYNLDIMRKCLHA